MAWDLDRVVVTEKGAFKIYSRDKPDGVSIPCPRSTIDHRFAAGEFWVAQEDVANRRVLISRSRTGNDWEHDATWTYPDDGREMGRLFIYPLIEGRFILIERKRMGFSVDGTPFLAVVAKTDEKKDLKIAHGLDLGLKEPLILRASTPTEEGTFNPRYLWAVPLHFAPCFLSLPDSVFLFFGRVGAFVELTPRGKYRRTVWLHPGLDEKRAADFNSYDWATLCAQPTSEGNILIAARRPDAVLNGRKRFPRTYSKDALMGPNAAATRELDKKALADDPVVEWWTLNTETGQFSPAAPPNKVPRTLESVERAQQFVFRFDPFGNLVFPYWNVTEKEPGH